MYTDIKRKGNYQYITTLFYKRKTKKRTDRVVSSPRPDLPFLSTVSCPPIVTNARADPSPSYQRALRSDWYQPLGELSFQVFGIFPRSKEYHGNCTSYLSRRCSLRGGEIFSKQFLRMKLSPILFLSVNFSRKWGLFGKIGRIVC